MLENAVVLMAVLLEDEGVLELGVPSGRDTLELVVVGELELDLEREAPVIELVLRTPSSTKSARKKQY